MVTIDQLTAWLQAADAWSYYRILGLKRNAPPEAVKEAFHRFALIAHPDRFVEEDDQARSLAAEVFKRGVEAYRILSRESFRARYDKSLAQGRLRLDDKAMSAPPPPLVIKTLEMLARTRSGKEYAVKADRFLTLGNLDDARVQLITALQCEPNNADLKERLTLLYEALSLEAM